MTHTPAPPRLTRRHAGLTLTLTLLSAACDPVYGPATRVELPNAPDIACITATLIDTDGTAPVRFEIKGNDGFGLLSRYGSIQTRAFIWVYGSHPRAVLQISNDGRRWDYHNSSQRMYEPLPLEEQARATQLVDHVNRRLATACRLPLRPEAGHTSTVAIRQGDAPCSTT